MPFSSQCSVMKLIIRLICLLFFVRILLFNPSEYEGKKSLYILHTSYLSHSRCTSLRLGGCLRTSAKEPRMGKSSSQFSPGFNPIMPRYPDILLISFYLNLTADCVHCLPKKCQISKRLSQKVSHHRLHFPSYRWYNNSLNVHSLYSLLQGNLILRFLTNTNLGIV